MLRMAMLVTVTALLVFSTSVGAQSGYDLYQKALIKERAVGDVAEAIRLYQRIVKEFSQDRVLTAKAQLRLGLLYERLGRKADAQQAFRTIVNRYADIAEVAAQARPKLVVAATTKNNHTATPNTLLVRRALGWPETNEDSYLLSSPAPNGRYLCYRDGKTGDLAVRELATGQKHRLTDNQNAPAEAKGAPQFSIFSPDSNQVAYTWSGKNRVPELRVIGLNGTGQRVLFRSDDVAEIFPAEWSGDRQFILTLFRSKQSGYQIVLVPTANGAPRVLKTMGQFGASKLSLSPDGRFVAYDFRPQENVRENDISLLATDGSGETPFIVHPAHDRLLGWSPDGKSILFGSDRAGTMSAWLQRVADAQPQGEPELIKPDLGRVFPMGFTRGGAYYYGLEVANVQAFLTRLDFATGKVVTPPVPVLRRSHGPFASPNFSPDGQYLAYGSVRSLTPWKPGSDVLTIRTLATGKERELTPPLEVFDLFTWSPDGRTLLLSGQESNGSLGLYQIAADTGSLMTLWRTAPAAGWILAAEYSPDGQAIYYYAQNRLLRRELASGQERELYRGPLMRFALAPDGQHLALAQGSSLKLITLADGVSRELQTAQRPELIDCVAWMPDGQHLLFSRSHLSPQGQRSELWQLALASGATQRLDLTIEGLRELRVHPDGQQLVYSSFQMRREVWTMEHFLKPATTRKARRS